MIVKTAICVSRWKVLPHGTKSEIYHKNFHMAFVYRLCVFVFPCIVLLGVFPGCGGDPFNVQPVSGIVTYNGDPVADASIVFVPRDSTGRAAVGVTGADGSFTLATTGTSKPGAMIGDYNVIISKEVPLDAAGRPTTFEALERERADLPPNVSTRPRMVSAIPARYSDNDNPALQATVQRGANEINFALED